jgi:hypothetical protein
MKKKRSWSGIIGLLMLVAGAKLFFSTDSQYLPMWVAWLIGPILWYGGFISVCYWFLRRIFQQRSQAADETERDRTRAVPVKKIFEEPNSAVYRCEFIRPGVSYSKLALIGLTLSLLVTVAASFR